MSYKPVPDSHPVSVHAPSLRHLLIIRHGETDANRLGIVQGHSQTELNIRGHEQARMLAERLATSRPRIDVLVSSDLVRAKQTAQAIADRLRLPLHVESAWRERCYGRFEGLTADERAARKHEIDALGNPPGAQCVPTYQRQIFDALEATMARFSQATCVAIVTHGGAGRALLSMLADGRLRTGEGLERPSIPHQAPNCSVTHLRVNHTPQGEATFTLECVHDVDHLDAARVTTADHG